ncbi:hypothetical protein PIB30_087433 [Stylosanthes scabra]|uniref:FBD domain-containing protein n=1 Tax=Stylosanthes scabra TaxID=79078 RepID=A0ABU6SUH8_9FABA|nr:hypothetical protein [Stylosanthes scabra]
MGNMGSMGNKGADQKSVDRISNLPQSLICEILWRLQSENALPLASSLAVSQHGASVPKLRIHYYAAYDLGFDEASLKALVSAAIGYHLEELKLDLPISTTRKFMFPSGLFNCCAALVHLELVSCIPDDLDCIGAKELTLTQVRFSSLKTLKMSFCHANLVLKILPGCPVLEILDLQQMKGRISCLIRATPLDLPEFRYLLNLEIVHGCFNTMYIFGMLESCPMIRVLTIHQIGVAKDAWTKPTSVPYCLASKLSKVNFSPYYGAEHDKEFIAYVLQEGLALKSISIGFASFIRLNSDRRQVIIDELSHLPKSSTTCQLYFKSAAGQYGLLHAQGGIQIPDTCLSGLVS